MTGEQGWIAWLGENPPAAWTLAIVAAIAIAVLLWIWHKGRPFAPGDVFRASRLSAGNHLFPAQVLITPTSVVHHTPRWVGRRENTIHIAHLSSVKIETGLLLSNVLFETSGGSHPILCHGHHKGDAVAMQRLIERYQTAYYRGPGDADPAPVGPGPSGR